MKKTTYLILICSVIIAAISLVAYKTTNKAYELGAGHIARISLEHFQFRGMMYQPKAKADAQNPTLETQVALQQIDPLFVEKPLEALARYQQLLETDPGHLGLRLRLGMLQLKMKQSAAAKENLSFVYEHKEAGLQPDAAWFLALLAVEERYFDKAKQLLQESIDSECSFLEEAKILLACF